MARDTAPTSNVFDIKSNQITFIVTSPQHKCLGEWNSYERAPESAKKQRSPCTEKPMSSMAESGTIADIQVSVRQITQQSLVSRWYEMRARSSQSLLSSDWTLASKIVGRGGRKARRLSLTRTLALFPLFRRPRRFLVCMTQTKGSDAVSVNNPPAFKNSKSGLRCAMEEPMFKSVSLS